MRRSSARARSKEAAAAAALIVGLTFLTSLAAPALAADRTAPIVRSVRMTRRYFSPNGDGIADSTSLSFWVSEKSRVTVRLQKTAAGPILRTPASNKTVPAGRSAISWDGRDAASSVVADGWYLARLYVKDMAGNRALRYPYSALVYVDTKAPDLERTWAEISPFSPNARPDGRRDTTVIGSRHSEGGHVDLKITGMGRIRRWSHVRRPAGNSYIRWNGRDQSGNRVPDGYYTAEARFHDWAGNVSIPTTRTCRVRVDTVPPAVTGLSVNIVTPYNPDGINDTATIRFTTREKAAWSYTIRNPVGGYLKGGRVASLSAGAHALPWNAKQLVSGYYVVVPKGRYPIRLAFGDNAGNVRVTVPRIDVRSYYLVCVDPGHGGRNGVYDSGAVGPTGLKESVANFDMGYYRLRPLLNAMSVNGYPVRVLMTRTVEHIPSMTLGKRSRLANFRGANIFVSIHCNAAGITVAHGTETYHQGSTRSRYLATMIQQKVLARTGLYNRGVMTEGFYVLRHTLVPAALHEVAFISNPREERLLRSLSFRRTEALGIRDGVVAYLKKYP